MKHCRITNQAEDQDPAAYHSRLGQNRMEEINLTNKSLGHILGPQINHNN